MHHDQNTSAATNFRIRQATVADAAVIAVHRTSMFLDMGTIANPAVPMLQDLTIQYLERALPAGEYLAWLIYEASSPETILAGAGMLLRTIPPFPIMQGPLSGTVALGKQALIMNVYVDHAWRRRGLANMLMRHLIAFAKDEGVESLVLHASKEGRPLYERLGFIATNEMRFVPT